jgi:hypothetical protein
MPITLITIDKETGKETVITKELHEFTPTEREIFDEAIRHAVADNVDGIFHELVIGLDTFSEGKVSCFLGLIAMIVLTEIRGVYKGDIDGALQAIFPIAEAITENAMPGIYTTIIEETRKRFKIKPAGDVLNLHLNINKEG